MMTAFKREILSDDAAKKTCSALQDNLYALVDLALVLKQAHWNVVGSNFRSVHLHLDEIIEAVRAGSDEVAERIVTLGVAADGRAATVAEHSPISQYSDSLNDVPATISAVSDALKTTTDHLRKGIEAVGDVDPISEDLLIGISAAIEKHLWMMQSQEL